MAKPIQSIHASSSSVSWQEVIDQHGEGLETLLKFCEVLGRAGVLDFLQGILEQKYNILHILVDQVNQDGPKNAINNLEGLLSVLGSMPPGLMEGLARAVRSTVQEGLMRDPDSEKPLGPLRIMKQLRDPDVSRTVQAGLTLLREMGKELRGADPTGADKS